MDSGRAQRIVLVAWLALVGLQVANTATAAYGKRGSTYLDYLPVPRKLVAGGIIFSGLAALAEVAPQLAVALAAGTDLAIALGPVVKGVAQPTVVPQTLSNLADTLAKIA